VALLSRRGTDWPGMAELVGELADRGTEVTVFACDVRDRDRLATVLGELAASGHHVTTAIHAAAYLNIAPLATTTLAEFAAVVDAKVAGAVNLAELLDPAHLRELVLYSSIAGVWGSGDHGAYAAANAFLDAYAQRCRAEGIPVTSVAWGIWDEPITVDRTDADLVVRRGLPFLDRTTAFEGMYQAMAAAEPFVAIADVDWARFVPVFTSARPSPLLRGLPEAAGEPDFGTPADGDGPGRRLRERLAGLHPADREGAVLDLVQANVAAVLGGGSGDGGGEAMAARQTFRQAGFDSLLSVELRNRLNAGTGLNLPPTLVFDYATPAALAHHLAGQLSEQDSGSADSVLGRLDRIEADVRALATDDALRTHLAARVGALLSVLRPPERPAEADLDAAGTTEELLELLDNTFGEA
jgi:NADP-dependent 3-hydroxy acid dehydrogenase YdfG